MTPSEYEAYVEEVVRQLDFGSSTFVARNAIITGVRQPGEYEIDIVVRVRLAGKIDFLLIVECKNWSRPVDRPVVQKLIQTKDAVAAHKAAIASPIGFTKEARDVAFANGIALWVLSQTNWEMVIGAFAIRNDPRIESRLGFLFRLGLLDHDFFFRPDSPIFARRSHALIEIDAVSLGDSRTWVTAFNHVATSGGSGVRCGLPGIDQRLAISRLADDCAKQIGIEVHPGV